MSAVLSTFDDPGYSPDRQIAQLRIPPHSIEGESSVLGGLLLDNGAWDRVGDLLVDTDFYRAEHKLMSASDEIATNAFSPQGKDVATILDEAEQKIFKIGEQGSRMKEGFQSMDTLVVSLLDRVTEMAENPQDVTGVPTGFYDLDRM